MTTIALAVIYLLVGASAFHTKPSLTIRLGALLSARRQLPPVEDFPPGYDTLKREYQLWVWNDEWDEYGVFRWDEMARQRPGYIKLMGDKQTRQAKVGEAARAGTNVREEMNDELKHIWYCEMEYGNYEEWLEDMAHFENLPDYVQSLREFLESGAGSSLASEMHNESASTSPIAAVLTRYSDCYRKSEVRWEELLRDSDKQLELPTNHNVAGLRTLVHIIDKAIIVRSYNRDGNPDFYQVAKLRSLVEFLFPLLEDYLPSSPAVDWLLAR